MEITFSSLLSMIIFNNLIIIIFYFLLKDYKFIINVGAKLILFCIFMITIKFYLPFEFSFMKTIAIAKVLPPIYKFITTTTISIFSYKIHLTKVFLLLWITGIIYLSIKTIISYFIFQSKVKICENITDKNLTNLLNKINATYNNKTTFRLVYNKNIESPFIFNIKSPVIIIPDISLSNEEWFYILSHEIAHYYQKDLFYKLFAEVLCIIYWWNPFIYLLKTQFETLLEINIDTAVTNTFNNNQKLDYLDCLLKIANLCKNNPNKTSIYFSFKSKNSFVISQRVKIILAHVKGTRPVFQILTLVISIFFTLITCSFYLIFEPYAIQSQDIENSFEIKDYDSYYMIKNNNNTYDLYCNSKYLATVNEIFDPNIKILQNPKEVFNENQ